MIPLAEIDDSDRIRPIKPAWVEIMAAKLAEGAYLPPVLVRPALPPEVREGCRYALVAGGHRLAAHRAADRGEVPADVRPLTRDQALLEESEENLVRNNPTALERMEFLRVRKEAYDRLFPETKRGGDRKSIKRQSLPFDGALTFAIDAAEKVGLGERTIRDDIALAKALSPAAKKLLWYTDVADNAVQLKRLAAHEPDLQRRLAVDIAEARSTTVQAAEVNLGLTVAAEPDPQEQIYAKLVDLYGRANARTKRRFEEHAELVRRSGRGGAAA